MLLGRRMLLSLFNMDVFQTSQMIQAGARPVAASKRALHWESHTHSSRAFILERAHDISAKGNKAFTVF